MWVKTVRSPQSSMLRVVTAKMHTVRLMIIQFVLVSCANYEFRICILLYFHYAWWNGNKFQPCFISRHVLKVICCTLIPNFHYDDFSDVSVMFYISESKLLSEWQS